MTQRLQGVVPLAPAGGSATDLLGAPRRWAATSDTVTADTQPPPRPTSPSPTHGTLLDEHRLTCTFAARLPLLSTRLGHVDAKSTCRYLQAIPELLAAGRPGQAFPVRDRPWAQPRPVLQGLFTGKLIAQRQANPHTVHAGRPPGDSPAAASARACSASTGQPARIGWPIPSLGRPRPTYR